MELFRSTSNSLQQRIWQDDLPRVVNFIVDFFEERKHLLWLYRKCIFLGLGPGGLWSTPRFLGFLSDCD